MKIKVLIASHIGKPWGGISIQNDLLLNSKLNELVGLEAIGTSAGNMDFIARGQWSISNILETMRNILAFIRTVNSFQPDIVDIGTAYGASFLKHGLMALYAHNHHCKVVMTFHCSIYKIFTGSSSSEKFTKTILNRIDGISAVSQEWLQIINELPKLKVRFIPNAIDTHQFREIHRIPKPYVEILFLGHIGRHKGIYDLIDAASILVVEKKGRFTINIVGSNLQKGEVEEINNIICNKHLEDYVKICEPVYGSSKLDVLCRADIMVLPSYHEGMPISIIEGMAAGLPIVATNVGGIPDQIANNVTGIMVSPHDAVNLARALSTLIEDESLRIKMGSAGRERAIKTFDIDTKVNNLFSFYTEIINR